MNYKINCHYRRAGFFSDLVHCILPSIIYLSDKRTNQFNVNWKNNLYTTTDLNLFDYFFDCNKNFEVYDEVLSAANCPYGMYFDVNIKHEKLLRASEVIKEIKLLESNYIKNIVLPFSENENILGVQHRKTDHHVDGRILTNEEIIKIVDNEFIKNSYDKIFFITDDNSSLNEFKTYFCDKLIFNECFRSNSETAVHHHNNLPFDKIKLAEQVLNDSYCLSKTNYKMICNSNVSTFSLLANYEKNNYVYLENL